MREAAASVWLVGALLCIIGATTDGNRCQVFNASEATGSRSGSLHASEFATYYRFGCPDGVFLKSVDVEFSGLIESTVWTCTDGSKSRPFGKTGVLDAGKGTAYFDVAITAARVRYSRSDLGDSGPPLVAEASFGGYNISSSSEAVLTWAGPLGRHETHETRGKGKKRGKHGKHGDEPGTTPVSSCPCNSFATAVQLWEAPSAPGEGAPAFLLGIQLECAEAIGTCTPDMLPEDGLGECEDSQGYADISSSMSVPITHMGSGSQGRGYMLTPFILGLGVLLCCQRGRQRRTRDSERARQELATDLRPRTGDRPGGVPRTSTAGEEPRAGGGHVTAQDDTITAIS